MDKVYLRTSGEYSDFSVDGVHRTESGARSAAERIERSEWKKRLDRYPDDAEHDIVDIAWDNSRMQVTCACGSDHCYYHSRSVFIAEYDLED